MPGQVGLCWLMALFKNNLPFIFKLFKINVYLNLLKTSKMKKQLLFTFFAIIGLVNLTVTAQCLAPTLQSTSVSNIAATSATINWTASSSTDTAWEILLIPSMTMPATPLQNPIIENGILLISASANPIDLFINTLTPSTRYYVYVRTVCSETQKSLWSGSVNFTTKPINDEIQASILVTVNPDQIILEGNTQFATTFGATASLPQLNPPLTGSGCGINGNDIWYKFVALSENQTIVINNVVPFNSTSITMNYSVFSGSPNNLTKLYCSNKNISSANGLIIGETYYLRIYMQSANSSVWASFNLNIIESALNDECINAISLTGETISNTIYSNGSITGATGSPQFNACDGTTNNDVWFKFVAASNAYLAQFTEISNLNVDLHYGLYSGSCGNLIFKECNTQTFNNQNYFNGFIIGETYYIRVKSILAESEVCNFVINLKKSFLPLTIGSLSLSSQQLVTDVLVNNPCVSISNVTSNTGTNFGLTTNGIGYFTNNNPNFPLTSGLILSTGNASVSGGYNLGTLSDGELNWTGDTELESIVSTATGTPMVSYNATKLEFDFTSLNEYMSFNFLFASEEYGYYQCAYSDSFAFLLTDLETGIKTNLAVVPNTEIPISVVTIRNNLYNGGCDSQNDLFFDQYFNMNNNYDTAINFNGQTNLMTASATIIPNHNYHIKLVIADRADAAYDSAVFIQGGSFAAGPPQCLDKIQLVAFVDENANGIKDNNENPFTYGSFTYQKNNTGEVSNINSPLGFYNIYDENPLNTYDFNYQIDNEYSPYFSIATTNYIDLAIALGSGTQTLYFPVTLTQGYNDVTVSIVSIGQPRPGFNHINKIVYKNLGVTAASGSINFTKPALTTILNVSQSGIVNTTEGFLYNFTNLAPFETRILDVTISVPAIPTVNIDDVLNNNVSINSPENDINLNNNLFENNQIVVAAYDPNDKMEAHGEKINFNMFAQDDYLFYTIRFQNTGTANAINVRIEDLLDSQFDAASIRMINASHNYIMERIDNKIIWKFDYIQLPGAIQNEALSQGYVSFKIKLNPGFEVGDLIPNNAEIYFDTNPAIVTNTFVTEFAMPLGTPTFNQENIVLYPNPASSIVQLNLQNSTEEIYSLVVFDLIGKKVKTITSINKQNSSIDVSDLSKGVYMVEIITLNKLKVVKKLVIE